MKLALIHPAAMHAENDRPRRFQMVLLSRRAISATTCPLLPVDYFPVIKSLTILPTTVIPKIIPVTIARKTAKTRVSLKTRKNRGIKIAQSIIVRQPVAKSFASNITVVLPAFPCRGSLLRIITEVGWGKYQRIRNV
jgi:hypothetical protein